MAPGRTARVLLLVLLSLLLSQTITAFSGQAKVYAQTGTSLVQIVPNASTMTTLAYDPDVIKVVIGVNNTVVWRNNDNVAHTATGSNFTAFTTGNINPGESGSYTFNVTGTFPYHCVYHPNMAGTVIVRAPSTTTSSTATTSGGGIPEFPLQAAAVTIFTFLITVAYFFVRKNNGAE